MVVALPNSETETISQDTLNKENGTMEEKTFQEINEEAFREQLEEMKQKDNEWIALILSAVLFPEKFDNFKKEK